MAAIKACAWSMLLMLFSVRKVQATIGCLNKEGEPVDWWAAIKAPLGARYVYVDSSSPVNAYKFTEPSDDLSSEHGNPLAETLQQLYDPSGSGSPAGVGYVIWNDDPGVRSKIKVTRESLHAHSKGVLGFMEDGGFYLLHSTPNFPDNPADDVYHGISNCGKANCGNNVGQFKYAQSYLCMTLDAPNMDNVAKVLRGDGMVVYGAQDGGLTDSMPDVAAFVQQDSSGLPKTVGGVPFQTVGGENFLLFGMAPSEPQYPVYLYEELIEPKLGAGLKVQTWTESPRFPSYCTNGCRPPAHDDFVDTLNVKMIKVPGTNLAWRAENLGGKGQGQQDHSKWAITIPETSDSKDVRVLCISDINRAGAQLVRGGGAACFMNNPGMWRLFSSIIQELEACQPTCPVSKPKSKRPSHTIKPKSFGVAHKTGHTVAHKKHAPDHTKSSDSENEL